MLIKFDCGPSKIQVLKMVKESMNLSLKEAKNVCDLGSIEVERFHVEDFIRQLRIVGGEVLNCIAQKKDIVYPNVPEYLTMQIGDTYKLNNNTTFVIKEVNSVMRDSIIEFRCIGEINH